MKQKEVVSNDKRREDDLFLGFVLSCFFFHPDLPASGDDREKKAMVVLLPEEVVFLMQKRISSPKGFH